MKLDWSARGWPRVFAFTFLGTAFCVAVAFAYDGYSFVTGTWHWGNDPLNNLILPLVLAAPLLFLLLSKMRLLAIAHHELMSVASTDGLTSLLNRRAFTEMVDGYLMRVKKMPQPSHGALLVIDVDHFKTVNDRFGHDRGDEALKLIARTIASTVRDADLVGRIGGEEFGVFLARQSPEGIPAVAERIRRSVNEAAFVADGHRHDLSVSVGGVIFDRSVPFDELYHDADERLYSAKNNGRNRVELCNFRHHPILSPVLH